MSSDEDSGEEELAKAILRYFLRNPQSADDLNGIATWRLLDERIHRVVEDTGRALTWLVAHGYLVAISKPGTDRLFRLNEAKVEDAARFVAGPNRSRVDDNP